MDIENISITGISGRFPNANNVEELKEALINGTDLITDNHDKWPYESLGTPGSMGVVKDLHHFDAPFFEINPKSAELHDPRGRKLLEVVFECITDAGINPCDLKGSNTGVFVAMTQNSLDYNYLKVGSGILSSSYLIANTISYTFDLRGPSSTIDTGCSSTIYAINQAVDNLRLGSCEAAVVCSAHTNSPLDSVEFSSLGVLNPEGRCKTFDDDRRGYVKSEAVVAIFLQKRQNASRIYATISGIGCNVEGYKEDGLTHPSSQRQMSLLKDIYQRYNINPNDVIYIDCHGTGTLVGDIEECQALADFFAATDRNSPLLVGSVKSNLGHTEIAGGLVSLVKILMVIQTNIIPANLHFKTPAIDIPALSDGKLKVVSSNTSYNGGLMAINSFGLGGANGHIIIKPYPKYIYTETKNKTYRLIQVSGRTEDAVGKLLDKIQESKDDLRFLSLIDNIFSTDIKNHNYRGCAILNGTTKLTSKCSLKKRPIWFSYSGMGSQWPEMGKDLMHFDVFRNTIKKCANAVAQYGLDLEDVIVNGTKTTFEDTINCFTSIVTVSVAITDLLNSFGIHPDGIIGHSLGEIGCAYGDGLITAEQATLIAYGRGWATKHTQLIPGLMASVGLSAEACEKLLPEDIYIACDNSFNNVTVSGPEASVQLFAEDLRSQGVFVRIVNTANIAFHSKYVEEVGSKLYDFIKNILPEPKHRKLWLPSALPTTQWDLHLGKYNSAEYQVHNFLNKVLYNQVLKRVPSAAILLEVAPCGLFQAIFRRALRPSITNLYMVKKFHNNNQEFLLESVGKCYLAGAQPILKNYYDKPQWPVGPETPMISPLIKWNHDYSWPVPKYDPSKYFGKKIQIDMTSKEKKFLLGHRINGTNTFPATEFIVLAWQTFANSLGWHFEKTPVVLEKIKFLKCPPLSKINPTTFTINILKSGIFEITEDGADLVATGLIHLPDNSEDDLTHHASNKNTQIHPDIKLNSDDVYKILAFRGHDYGDSFRGIVEIDCNNKSARVRWNKNWTTFLDSIFQAATLMENSTSIVPTAVSRILVDPLIITEHLRDQREITLNYNTFQKTSFCKGLEIRNTIWSSNAYKSKYETPQVHKCQFIPNISTRLSTVQFEEILQITLQLVVENTLLLSSLSIAEISNRNSIKTCEGDIKNMMHLKYLKHIDYSVISEVSYLTNSTYNLIIVRNLEINEDTLNYLANVDEGTFILSEISDKGLEVLFKKSDFVTVFKRISSNNSFLLLKKSMRKEQTYTVIKAGSDGLDLNKSIEQAIARNITRILLIDQHIDSDGIDIYRYVKNDYPANIQLFCIQDTDAEVFNVQSTFYQEQIRKGFAVNVLKNREWGTYRHLKIVEVNALKCVDSCYLSRVNDTVGWVQQHLSGLEKNRVNVYYGSIGFWDQQNLNKPTDEKLHLGMAYSGINNSGIRVMGISPSGTLTTHLVPHRDMYWIIPREWSLKEAATVPFIYTMSYYGLFIKGNLRIHDTILINYSGCCFDFAAICFALDTQCTVFVGINLSKHVRYLVSHFPKLKYNIINFSKKNAIERVMQKTHGDGIDILFNLGQDMPRHVTDVLKHGGRIINISFNDMPHSNVLDELVEKDCTFYRVTFANLLKETDYTVENIKNSIQEYIRTGAIKPFSSKAIDMMEINSLLEHPENDWNQNEIFTVKMHRDKHALGKHKKYFLANSKTYFSSEKCYVIISDLDDFGLEVIKWLGKKGAKKFIISSTRRVTTGYQIVSLENLKKHGNTIIITYSDTTCIKGAEELLDQAIGMGDVGGIFCFAMKLQNKSKHSLMDEECWTIYRNKIKMINNIDVISRRICNNLDYFVVFLSQHLSLGYTGWSNYGYANASLENLCEIRRQANFPAMAVEWGPITNIDSMLQSQNGNESVNASPQTIPSCLDTLDLFMQLEHTIVSSTMLNFNETPSGTKKISITESVAKIFGIKDVNKFDLSTPFVNLGMDSIMGFEIKSVINTHFNVNFSIMEIRKLALDDIKKLEDNIGKMNK